MTRVGDLSRADMEKVRSLTLIELTALFDSHGLALHRRKPIKKKVKGSVRVFFIHLFIYLIYIRFLQAGSN